MLGEREREDARQQSPAMRGREAESVARDACPTQSGEGTAETDGAREGREGLSPEGSHACDPRRVSTGLGRTGLRSARDTVFCCTLQGGVRAYRFMCMWCGDFLFTETTSTAARGHTPRSVNTALSRLAPRV